MAVPFFDVFVSNRPVHRKTIPCRSIKVKVRPTLYLSGPEERLSTYLIASDPVKRFLLHVRMIGVFYKKMHGILTESIASADDRIGFLNFLRNLVPMGKFIRKHIRRRVVFDMLHIASTLQHEGFYSQIAKLFGSPSTTDARTDDDGLISSLLFATDIQISH